MLDGSYRLLLGTRWVDEPLASLREAGELAFEPLLAFDDGRAVKPFEELFFTDDARNRSVYDAYVHAKACGTEPAGCFTLADVTVVDHWGLVLSEPRGMVLSSLNGFGWMHDQLEFMAREGTISFEPGADGESIRPRFPVEQRVSVEEPCAMLSFAGAYTYGHWIVDILPRFELLAALGMRPRVGRFMLPSPILPWMRPFLALYGIEDADILGLDKRTAYEVRSLVAPTVVTQICCGTLPELFVRRLFRRVQAIAQLWATPETLDDWSGPVLLVHTAVTSAKARVLANQAEVAEAVEAAGGRVADPTRLALPELLTLLRRASVVIGQDSSALHNLAFSGNDLVVIETEPRANALHVAIQSATDHRISFLPSHSGPSGWVVDVDEVRRRLEHGQSHGC